MGTAKIINDRTGEVFEYYIDDRLKRNLDEKILPSLHKKDKDCVICIDGKEGGGKSTLAFQLGRYVDPSLSLSRVVFDPDSFREAIFKAKKGQCVIFDEAFTGFSSRSSLSGINRVLVSLMMQMRQKNLFVIIVLPTIFLLDKYVALFRAKALIHVFESKGVRGYFKLYNSRVKKMLYLTGQKTYSYNNKLAKTNFRGRFYGKFALGNESVDRLYRKKKAKALEDTEKSPMSAGQAKYKEQRDLFIYLLRKNTGKTYQEIEELLIDFNIDMSFQQIGKICAKFGDKATKKDIDTTQIAQDKTDGAEKEEIIEEIEEIPLKTDEIEEKIDDSDEIGLESDENDDF